MVRCRSPSAPEPRCQGVPSCLSTAVSARQRARGDEEGSWRHEDDVGDEVTSTKGSRAKLSSFSCFPQVSYLGKNRATTRRYQQALSASLVSHTRREQDWVTLIGEQTSGTSSLTAGSC